MPVKVHQVGVAASPRTTSSRGLDAAFLTTRPTASRRARADTRSDAAGVAGHTPRIPAWRWSTRGRAAQARNFNFGAAAGVPAAGLLPRGQDVRPVRSTCATRRPATRSADGDRRALGHRAARRWPASRRRSARSPRRSATASTPTVYLFALRRGVDSAGDRRAARVGLPRQRHAGRRAVQKLSEASSASLTFDRLIMGFMGLGLIVGVAALGVISARAVVERRQQIGVLRAIGFRRRMVQPSFLLESSFIALTSIVVGTVLGLAVAYNVIHDSQQQPSWSNLSFDVALADADRHLPGRLRRRARDHVPAGAARLARLSGRGAALPVALGGGCLVGAAPRACGRACGVLKINKRPYYATRARVGPLQRIRSARALDRRPLRGLLHRPHHHRAARGGAPVDAQGGRHVHGVGQRRLPERQAAQLDDPADGAHRGARRGWRGRRRPRRRAGQPR